MGRKFLSLKSEQGDASIFLAMIMALGVGTAVYYNMDKLNQTLKSSKVTGQKQKAETQNISSLSTATALMSFTGTNPQADNPGSMPYLYPDPYIGGDNSIGTPRNAPGVSTWSFANSTLTVRSPGEGELKGSDFAGYIKDGVRPKLSNPSTIKFKKPVFDDVNKKHIVGYEVEVTSKSFDNQQLTSKATIDVPPPLQPKCVLRSADGQNRFQPNAPMTLELVISGIAEEAWIPKSIDAMTAPEGIVDHHSAANLDEDANSVRLMNKVVRTWQVTTPRPLAAVDGQKDVEIETYAYIQRVDSNSKNGAFCKFRYFVAPPAICKLWTDKASVAPGQCVNISSELAGPVQPGSLVMAAADPTGKIIGGLTQNGSNGTFCTPSVSNYSTGVNVSKDSANRFAGPVAALDTDQRKALYEELKIITGNLKSIFKPRGGGGGGGGGGKGGKDDDDDDDKINWASLHSLSVHQYNDLWSLDVSDWDEMSQVDLNGFTYLKTLSGEQTIALKSRHKSTLNELKKFEKRSLSNVGLLSSVDADVLKQLAGFDSVLLMAYLGGSIDSAANTSAVPVNYKILGTVSALDGTKNSCLVHVTAGNNKCPFFGSQYPNYGQQQTLTIVSGGSVGTMTLNFKPSKPNWEVAGVATSPVKVEACPNGARCFALDIGGNRTPFTVVDNADSASCNATTRMRVDLGCFEANTKIRMGDGSEKPIRQLKENDLVWNPVRQKAMAIRHVTPGPEKLPLWSIQTDSGRVRVTSKHPFLTPSGIRPADELKAGDRILGSQGEEIIRTVNEDKAAPAEWVWNFEIASDSKDPADHAILADGVVTGDLYLQEQLGQTQSRNVSQLKP
jgi:hypothetical protein